jgi:hypothetical protein
MPLSAQIAALCVLVAGLSALAAWIVLRRRGTPEKRERQRRLAVHHQGRIGDAMINEVTGDALYYSYSVGGVQYEASQDITALRDLLPAQPERLIGWSGMKYSSNNPANSILICEEWSGLRGPAARSAEHASADRDSVDGNSMDGDSAHGDGVRHEGQDAALAQGPLHQGVDRQIAE